MMQKNHFIFLVVLVLYTSCYVVKKTPASIFIDGTKTDSFFTGLFKQYPEYFDNVIARKNDLNIQMIYTQIDRDENNFPKLTNYYYNVNPNRYFYPASTVKLPVAALALQRINELKDKGIARNTTMLTDSAYGGQTAVDYDSTTSNGKPTIGHYIKKIFLTSDNDAFNRLYEFLGQEYINENLHKRGYTSAQVLHRLDIFLTEDENRHTNPVKFLADNNNVLYQQPMVFNETKYQVRTDSLGTAFYKKNELINMPMNFSKKNRIILEDLHNILRSIIFPQTVPAKQRFNLIAEDYKFLYQYMSQFPSETLYPTYDTAIFPDAYVKFLMHGDFKESLPKNIRIFNKVGDAYGQMLDVAYIIDLDKKIEFFLSAAINCDTDGIVNDDRYDYETIGFPFMKNLGKVIYDFEVKRKRSHSPDLSAFKIIYDK